MNDLVFYKLIEICVGFGLEHIPQGGMSINGSWRRLMLIRGQLEMRARFAAAGLAFDEDAESLRAFYELLRAAVDDGKRRVDEYQRARGKRACIEVDVSMLDRELERRESNLHLHRWESLVHA